VRKPRPRTRPGAGKAGTPHKEEDRLEIFDSEVDYGVPHLSRNYGPNLGKHRGAAIKKSTRWIGGGMHATTAYSFPYIDNLGRFTGLELFKWSCDPRTYIASVVSTIARRLLLYCYRHNNKRVVSRNLDRIVRVSAYYALSKNIYLWDRVLFFSRDLEKRGTLLHRAMVPFLCKTSDSIRFVYSHVSQQTKWLLFRAERPRDKLAHNKRGSPPLPPGSKWMSTRMIESFHVNQCARALANMGKTD